MGQSPPSDPEAPPIDPIEAPTPPAMPPSSGTPVKNASFDKALSNARFSMSERDLTGARTHLESARKVATTDQQKHAADRVGIVLDHLEGFWQGMHKAAASLQSGLELPVKDTVVVVVESGPDVLTIRSAGRNLDYRVEELPGALVMAVADSWFEKSGASDLLIATFLCFDGKGHAEMGRSRLQKAAAAGVDVKLFLEELKAGGSGTDFEKTRTGTGPAENAPRSPQIDPEMLRQAKESVRKKFATQIAAAKTPAAKQALARKLMDGAQQAADTPDVQVVMLQEAQRLAIESEQVELTLQVIDALVGLGVASPVPLKADAFERLAKTARGGDARQIAQAALQLIPKAIEGRDRTTAARLAEVALAAARNSNNAVLMRQAMAAKQQLQAKP